MLVIVAVLMSASPSNGAVDECWLDDDRCYRRALELREARARCDGARFVVDETAFSSGQHRLQGVACGAFHSSPVTWEWLAATSGPVLRPLNERHGFMLQRGIARPWFFGDFFEGDRREFNGDGGEVSELVRTRLRTKGSRLEGALVIVRGDLVFALEVHPNRDDLRRDDLPWSLLPWRPMWFFMPALDEKERTVLSRLRLLHFVRTDDVSTCIMNRLTGELLLQGPSIQDSKAVELPCDELASRIADEPALAEVQRRLVRQLSARPRSPAFARPSEQLNVESLTPNRITGPLR